MAGHTGWLPILFGRQRPVAVHRFCAKPPFDDGKPPPIQFRSAGCQATSTQQVSRAIAGGEPRAMSNERFIWELTP